MPFFTAKAVLMLLLILVVNRATLADQPKQNGQALLPSLANAIRIADLEGLERILTKHPDQINSLDANGNTPLHLASLYGHVDCVHRLIDCGADISATNDWDATPLVYGVVDADVVRVLLKHDANPNAETNLGTTPFLAALRRGQSFDVARLLIQAGADVNATLYGAGTPLFVAIGSGDRRTIELLISSGARLDVVN